MVYEADNDLESTLRSLTMYRTSDPCLEAVDIPALGWMSDDLVAADVRKMMTVFGSGSQGPEALSLTVVVESIRVRGRGDQQWVTVLLSVRSC